MKRLDLGQSGSKWEERHNLALINAVRELYWGHFPYSINPKEVFEDFSEQYESDRSRNSTQEQLIKVFNKIGGVFQTFESYRYEGNDFFVAREFSDVSDHIDDIDASGIVYENGFTKSFIRLKRIGESHLFFTYPTILDADYGKIFSTIFSLPSCEKVDKDLSKFYYIYDKPFISIPLDSARYGRLPMAAHLLLDFLFSKLLGDIRRLQKENCSKEIQRRRFEVKKEIRQLLSSFNKLGYSFSQSTSLKNLVDNTSLPLDSLDYSLILKIQQASDEDCIKVPQFRIWMSGVFELYVYSYFCKEDYPSTVYKPFFENVESYNSSKGVELENRRPIEPEEEEEKKLEPDVYLKDSGRVYDAKYKFQYNDDNYCDINDAHRMIRYLFHMRDVNKTDFPRGVFVYPDIRKCPYVKPIQEVMQNRGLRQIDKMGISFPVDDSRQSSWIEIINI